MAGFQKLIKPMSRKGKMNFETRVLSWDLHKNNSIKKSRKKDGNCDIHLFYKKLGHKKVGLIFRDFSVIMSFLDPTFYDKVKVKG